MLTLDQLIYDPASGVGAKVGAFITDVDGHQLNVNADGTITVGLDANSLAALENITVTVSSEVEIKNDSGNPIPVNGTVELGATSLAALEAINVQNGAGAAAVNIQDGGNSITVDAVNLAIRALTFAGDKVDASGSRIIDTNSSIANSNVSVTTTAAQLTPSPLANRTKLIIQNNGVLPIYVGTSAVTSTNGIKISGGANAELNLNASAQIWARTASGSSDVRILESAY